MARQVNSEDDNGFEILNEPSAITTQEKFELIEDEALEILPCTNPPSSLINTNAIQYVTIIEKPVSTPINMDKPIVNELENSSLSSSSSSSLTNSSRLPTRYGSAAVIPHNEGFDLKSILTPTPNRPPPPNDLLSFIRTSKPKNPLLKENSLQQLLIDNDHDRQSLVQVAKQAQEDFINAIRLD